MLTKVLFCRTIYLYQLILCQPQILISKAHRHTRYLIIVLLAELSCFLLSYSFLFY